VANRMTWSRVARLIALGLAGLAVSFAAHRYVAAPPGGWPRVIAALVESLVMIGISLPIVISVAKSPDWGPAFRYFVVWSVGVCSVLETISYLVLEIESDLAGVAFWLWVYIAAAALIFWFVGLLTCIVAGLGRVFRRGRGQFSRSTPGTPAP